MVEMWNELSFFCVTFIIKIWCGTHLFLLQSCMKVYSFLYLYDDDGGERVYAHDEISETVDGTICETLN